ncbi:Fur-regulated basic protein FbpA [Oceanobacillus sp. CF4.6]|uniref:Fur-regulated basic protein FbpA n=1 Tax=Oceanobacillus sp. CF4.6 TaxID=3373080 RepID=UPI003EE56EA1
MKEIDAGLRSTEVTQRKKYLIKQLHKMRIYKTSDGRRLDDVSLYTLEWTHIQCKINAAKAYGDRS